MSQVFERLQNALSNMSEAKGAVARFLLENWQDAAFLTASRIAQKVGVSESVVVRLAQDIDYSGFPDLQSALREAVRTRLTSVPSVDHALQNEGMASNDVVQRVFEQSVKNLQGTCNANASESFEKAVQHILSAKRIAVIASRNASGPAMILTVHLNEALKNSMFLRSGRDDLFDHLRTFGRDDLVIVIGLPAYSRHTVQAVDFIRERAIPHLAITDSIASPLAHGAVVTLFTQHLAHGYAHSHLGTVFIVDVIVDMLFAQATELVTISLEELDAINTRYGYTSHERHPHGG